MKILSIWCCVCLTILTDVTCVLVSRLPHHGDVIPSTLHSSREVTKVFDRPEVIDIRGVPTENIHKSSPKIASYEQLVTNKKESDCIVDGKYLNRWPGRRKRDMGMSNLILTQHFIERPVTPGEDVSLQCTANGEKPPRFSWERDGVTISPNTDTRYTLGQIMSPSGGVMSQLNITRTRIEDGGLYTCTAVEGDSTISHMARLDIYGPPYIRNMPPIKVQNGEPLKLRCPYYGYPISKIEWEHKGKKVVSSLVPQQTRYKRNFKDTRRKRRRRQAYGTSANSLLAIQKIVKEENGDSYVCIVYSPTGEMARRSFEIQVVEAPELDELRVGSGLKEGQIVQITCNIVGGDPPIYFSWLKDGKKIPSNLKITERSADLFSVLIMKRVSLEHCGRYTCIATNHVGKVNQTAELYINVGPKWVEEPQNTSLLLGQRGVVHCNANGYPAPQIHWMKRDDALGIWRPVLDLAGGGVMSFSNGTLVIEMVTLVDEGMYSCSVENGVGGALSKNIWLGVNKPVHFESLSTNLTTKIGFPVQLSCQPLGDHPIRTKWTLDGRPLDFTTSRVKLSESMSAHGVASVIDVGYVETRDSGNYQCKASNPYGVATNNIYLSVLEPPRAPAELRARASARGARLRWRAEGAGGGAGGAAYYALQLRAARAGWDGALRVNVTRQSLELLQSYELKDLQPATNYMARVAAGNQIDLSPYTQPIHFTTLAEAPSSSPTSVQVLQTENPGELTVNWSPPPRETHNGELQGYHVKAVPKIGVDIGDDDKTRIVKVMSKNGKQDTLLSGLLKNTRYAVSVSAFNSAGSGPFSLPVYHTTREGAPEEAPAAAECAAASPSSLRVGWQPIAARGHGGTLLGYTVYYALEEEPWHNMTSPQTEIYLQALMKYTNYTVKVAGYSSYGVGPFSYPILCATLQDVPGPPSNLKVLVASSKSLLISWNQPEHPNGAIVYYTIYAKPVSSSVPPKTYRVQPSMNTDLNIDFLSYELKDLVEFSQYEIRVSATTMAGEGPKTSSIIKELTNRVGAGAGGRGGRVAARAGAAVALPCRAAGAPAPRALWYRGARVLHRHPRYRTATATATATAGDLVDHALTIIDIDPSLGGNYTCLVKNLYGSDSVSYNVVVLPTPDPPTLRATPYKDTIKVEWDQPINVNSNRSRPKISYNLTWKEMDGSWEEAWSTRATSTEAVVQHTIGGLRCGTRYSLRLVASNSVGASKPALLDISTLGGAPISPSTVEWFWSNASHIYVQLSGWEENGCEITKWSVEYRELGASAWRKADNGIKQSENWDSFNTRLHLGPTSYAIGDLVPAQWYQVKVVATNSAGSAISVYNYATTTLEGESIGPPTEYFDINMFVITCSSILLTLCLVTCIYILLKRRNHNTLTEYRNSLSTECKSESGQARGAAAPPAPAKLGNELYEISPYAQFALGFKTFGHVENQEPPIRMQPPNDRYHSETSFQIRSESEDSDCISHTTTLKTVPRRPCRVTHHR